MEAIAPVLAQFVEQVGSGEAYRASDALVASSSRTHRARQLADVFEHAILAPQHLATTTSKLE
jgi:hypothetical protein